jgi:hypothetical protein
MVNNSVGLGMRGALLGAMVASDVVEIHAGPNYAPWGREPSPEPEEETEASS